MTPYHHTHTHTHTALSRADRLVILRRTEGPELWRLPASGAWFPLPGIASAHMAHVSACHAHLLF